MEHKLSIHSRRGAADAIDLVVDGKMGDGSDRVREEPLLPENSAGTAKLTLISHHLCPYVQRAAIALQEKAVPFQRIYVDLSEKPDWFKVISPLGKVPLLLLGAPEAATRRDAKAIFESAVILEYLEETEASPLHPSDPLNRARHRGWIEFASAVLNDIAALYNAADAEAFAGRATVLGGKLSRLEDELGEGPYFSGDAFTLVDAAFAPVFRYFDTFERGGALKPFGSLGLVSAWREALAARPSVKNAVPADYDRRLEAFLARRQSHIARFYA